jgi:hypothetical protein
MREALKPEMEACPSCGSRDRHVEFQDSGKGLEMIGVKQKFKGYHKFKKRSKHGEKVSNTGRPARETLIIDKETKRKYHFVEEQNEKGEWVIVHNKDEPL